ncbi:MAG: hypothetical protein R2730_16860 [Chitinophagales bacterium]
MKNLKLLFAAIMLISMMATSCSDDEEVVVEEGQTVYEVSGSWNCSVGEDCQDVYEMEFKVGTQLSIVVDGITGNSVVRLAVYGPNSALGGTNIITGNSKEINCKGQNETESAFNVKVLDGGVHKIAVTRDWGSSMGASGNYKLSIIASEKFKNISQTVEDVNSLASGDQCL